MARKPFNCQYREIVYKKAKHNHKQSFNWRGILKPNQKRTTVNVRWFSHYEGCYCIGYELEIQVYCRTGERRAPRMWVSVPMLRTLPKFIQDRLMDAGLRIDEIKYNYVPFTRFLMAITGTAVLNELDNIHHHNEDTLDDRMVNLQQLSTRDHFIHHLKRGDVPGNQYHPEMTACGWFCYRLYHKKQDESRRAYAKYIQELKDRGEELPQTDRQKNKHKRLFRLTAYHHATLRAYGLD